MSAIVLQLEPLSLSQADTFQYLLECGGKALLNEFKASKAAPRPRQFPNGLTAYITPDVKDWAKKVAGKMNIKKDIFDAPVSLDQNIFRGKLSELEDRLSYQSEAHENAIRKHKEASVELMALILSATWLGPFPGVYFLIHGSEVIYVGQSKNVLARMSGHAEKVFDSVKAIRVDDAKQRLHIEGMFIRAFEPRENAMCLEYLRRTA